jgi:hypothetical protein
MSGRQSRVPESFSFAETDPKHIFVTPKFWSSASFRTDLGFNLVIRAATGTLV